MSAARLIELLSLLQRTRAWSGRELAERLEVSPRTVRRDIERLRDLGYPVEATKGATGGYRLTAGGSMPPLLLDDEEAVAITVGLRVVTGHAVEGIEDASVRALAKLLQVLPSRLRQRVGALGSTSTAQLADNGPVVDSDDLTMLAAAVQNQERVRLDYEAADGTRRERRVEPYGVVSVGRRWYLVAFDVDQADWRTFRLDRVGSPRSIGGRGAPRELPAETPADYVVETLLDLAPTYEAVVTLHVPLAEAKARLGEAIGDLEALDEHRCRLRSRSDTPQWLAARLGALDCDFELHEPPELIEHFRSFGTRLVRAAKGRWQEGAGAELNAG